MTQPILPYAAVILKLLSDILYHEDKEWETLLTYQSAVRQHFAAIGLALRFDEAEGYAYLVQPDPTQEEEWEGERSAAGSASSSAPHPVDLRRHLALCPVA